MENEGWWNVEMGDFNDEVEYLAKLNYELWDIRGADRGGIFRY